MHNKRIGRDDLLKIEVRHLSFHLYLELRVSLTHTKWARTPPSASWRFDSGRDREGPGGSRRSPRRRGRTPSPRRGGGRGDYSPRKDERRERDYDRRDRGDRSRSPDDRSVRAPQKIININLLPTRDREMKDERDDVRENGTNGEDRKGKGQEQREADYLNRC
jgi:hypothetical protein